MWYDSLEGVQFNQKNGPDVAKWVGGQLQDLSRTDAKEVKSGNVITVTTARGEILIREGDWVTKDREGRFRVVRLHEIDIRNEVRPPRKKVQAPKPGQIRVATK